MRLALALMLVASPAWAKTHLVAVGNDLGQKDEPRLRYAEADAERFARVLRELGRVGAEEEVILRGGTASAFRSVLLRTNAQIRNAPAGGAEDALIVYYSGHADANGLHLGDTTLPFEELKTIVEASPAKVRVLVLDSCRSGGITQLKGVKPAEPFAIRLDDRMEIEGLAIIASSASSEDSQESDQLRASFFTHHLVNALRGAADRDGNARVTIGEAYSYAYQETLRSSGRTLHLQHPTYAYELKGRGDFVLTHLSDGGGRFGTLSIGEPGTYLLFEEAQGGVLAAEVHVRDEGAKLVLAPGRYFVQRRGDTSYREYGITLERDGLIDLDAVAHRDVKYASLLRKGGGAASAVHGIVVLGGARGPVLDGYSIGPQLVLGYALDLSELSLGAQLRYGASSAGFATATDYALRLRAERYLDLEWVSLSLGLLVEGALTGQRFDAAPAREAWSFGFGALLGVEHAIDALVLRVEGGPMSYVLRHARTVGGAVVGDALETPLTWWAAAGAGWRF